MKQDEEKHESGMKIVPLGSGGTTLDLGCFLNSRDIKLAIQASEIQGKDDLLANSKQ